jgi:nucleoid-associated protein YgaU
MGENAKSVKDKTKPFYQLVKIQKSTHALPKIRFDWGEEPKGLSFTAIVESITEKFTLFNPLGFPLRATLSVTFRQYRTLKEMVTELESADHATQYVVNVGETLPHIAADKYGDPALWRVIADYNKLESPRKLKPGTVLLMPALER